MNMWCWKARKDEELNNNKIKTILTLKEEQTVLLEQDTSIEAATEAGEP